MQLILFTRHVGGGGENFMYEIFSVEFTKITSGLKMCERVNAGAEGRLVRRWLMSDDSTGLVSQTVRGERNDNISPENGF